MDHILLVDDEPLILKTLRNQLELDFTVHTAETGTAALEILKLKPIKVIVSDQKMPQMLGHELLRQAKIIKPNTSRILLTGYSDLQAIISSVNAGEIFRFVSKPWKAETLLSVIKLGIAIHDRLESVADQLKNVTKHFATASENVPEKTNLLFVGYDALFMSHVKSEMEKKFNILYAETPIDAFKIISTQSISVMMSELKLMDYDPLEFLGVVKNEYPAIVQIVLTSLLDSDYAIKCINDLNVFRYMVKSDSVKDLEKIIDLAVMKNRQYKTTADANAHQIAKKVNPALVPDFSQKTSILDRIKAVQATLQQNKTVRSF